MKQKKKKKYKTGPNPATKKLRLNCLKVTIAELVKKILAPYTPEKTFSAPVCCEKNYSGPRKNPDPPAYLMVAPLREAAQIVLPNREAHYCLRLLQYKALAKTGRAVTSGRFAHST